MMSSVVMASGGGGDTIHDAFMTVAATMGDSPALVKAQEDAAEGGGGGAGVPSARCITFHQLRLLSLVFASHLEGSEVKVRAGPPRTDEEGALIVGASVAVMLDSSDELMVAYFACLTAGQSFAPIETTLPPSAIEGQLAALRAAANLTHLIVGDSDNNDDNDDDEDDKDEDDDDVNSTSPLSFSPPPPPVRTLAIALRGGAGARRWRLKVSETGMPPLTLFGDVSVGESAAASTSTSTSTSLPLPSPLSFRGSPDDACHIIHTGGSTGAPKAVVCTHRGSVASHAARAAALPYDCDLRHPACVDVTGALVFGVWDAVCALLAGSRASMLPVGGSPFRLGCPARCGSLPGPHSPPRGNDSPRGDCVTA